MLGARTNVSPLHGQTPTLRCGGSYNADFEGIGNWGEQLYGSTFLRKVNRGQ